MDDHFDFKEYINQINSQYLFLQKMLKDCSFRKISLPSAAEGKMEIEETPVLICERTKILSPETALSEKFLKNLLLLLKKEIKQFFLDEDNNIITSHLYNMCTLLSTLMDILDSVTTISANYTPCYLPFTYKI
jgi:hypothetical protein